MILLLMDRMYVKYKYKLTTFEYYRYEFISDLFFTFLFVIFNAMIEFKCIPIFISLLSVMIGLTIFHLVMTIIKLKKM